MRAVRSKSSLTFCCLVLAASISATCGDCRPGQFKCPKSSKCIAYEELCDGINDCEPDHDVEKSIRERQLCEARQLESRNKIDICNKEVIDSDDERWELCKEQKCDDSGVKCSAIGKCVPASKLCDGINDCPNGKDEEGANCTSKENGLSKPRQLCSNKKWVISLDKCLGPDKKNQNY